MVKIKGQDKASRKTRAALKDKKLPVDRKETFMERRELIRDLIIELGVDNISKTQLAEKFGVTRQAIHDDINYIMTNIPAEELARERAKAYYGFLNIDKKLGKIIAGFNGSPRDQIKALDTASSIMDRKAKVFESYGLKEKMTEVIELRTGVTLEDLKKAKEEAEREAPK